MPQCDEKASIVEESPERRFGRRRMHLDAAEALQPGVGGQSARTLHELNEDPP
jgi:hypothetical protein